MSITPHSGSETAGSGGRDPLLGTTLDDRYALQRQLGEGGMGRVYLAEDVRLRRQVAVKLMSAALSSQSEFRSRFQREALLQAQAAHPGIIQVLDTGECADGAYIVLEYSEGRSLRELLKRGPLRLPRVLDLIEQLLEVLEFAHRNGIIHRDLKPTNILIERDGSGRERVRVLDFGLAKLLAGDGGGGGQMTQQLTLTRPGSAFGTLEYMAPEQAAGEEVDHRADLYSTGVILYELLSGKPPIRDRTPSGYLRKLFSEPVAPLQESHPHLNVPDEVSALVAWALEKEPSERPNSALAFLETLRGYRTRSAARTSGEVPRTVPDRVAARPPEPSRSGSAMLFIGWLLAFAGAGAAGFFWHQGKSDRETVVTLRADTESAHEGLASAGFATGTLADGIEQLARKRASEAQSRQEKILKLTQDLGKASAKVEQLEEERNRLREASEAARGTPTSTSDAEDPRLAGLEAAKTKLEGDLREERGRVLKLQEDLRRARDEREKAETLAGGLDEEKGRLQKQVQELQAKVASAAPTAGAAQELLRATTRVAQLQEELRQKETDLRSARDEARRWQEQLTAAQQRSGSDTGRIQELEARVRTKEREVADLRRQVESRRKINQPKLELVNETGTTIRIDRIEASFIDDATFTFKNTELKPFPRLEIESGERLAPKDLSKGWNGQCLMVTVEYKVWDKTTRRWEYRTPIEGSTTKGSTPGVFVIRRRR